MVLVESVTDEEHAFVEDQRSFACPMFEHGQHLKRMAWKQFDEEEWRILNAQRKFCDWTVDIPASM